VNVWKTFGLLVVFGLLMAYVMVYEQGAKPDFEADRTVVQLLGFDGLQDVVGHREDKGSVHHRPHKRGDAVQFNLDED